MAEITGTSKQFTNVLKRIYAPRKHTMEVKAEIPVEQIRRGPYSVRQPTTLRQAQRAAAKGTDLRVQTAYKTAKKQKDLKNRYLAGD